MTKPFVYDERTSSLFGPDGDFLKKVFCPKTVKWNQLIQDEPMDRSRGCNQCKERILNLDSLKPEWALAILNKEPETCVYATRDSKNVIFLKDDNNPSSPKNPKNVWLQNAQTKPDLPIISTVRNLKDIQRAVQMGFWPDVRKVEYNTAEIKQKICVYQNTITGEIQLFGDYRMSSTELGNAWEEVIPWTYYYEHHQKVPIAAYLIPKDLANNTEVLITDPIEDLIGSTWNQGDTYRASNITAKVVNKKVILNSHSIQRSDFVG